jgi:RES domain-containing protein
MVDGRWHSAGRPIVYTSANPSLCLIERVAHADEWLHQIDHDRVLLTLALPHVSHAVVTAADLDGEEPRWRDFDNVYCRRLGDEWLRRGVTCALLVPSAVVPQDVNVLLNPAHRDFGDIIRLNENLNSGPVVVDPRLGAIVNLGAVSGKR